MYFNFCIMFLKFSVFNLLFALKFEHHTQPCVRKCRESAKKKKGKVGMRKK